MSAPRLILFDCDSTLSAIEGIDELGRLRGPVIFAEVEAMTTAAMEGRIPVESVFSRRLEIIHPTAAHVAEIGRGYVATVEPTASQTLAGLRRSGWTPMIVSGGFRNAIRPLADHLGIERIEAVDLHFAEDGSYVGFDETYPTTRSGGKPEIVQRLRAELRPAAVVMVGDGVSDLEAKLAADLFVGFGRYVTRERVRREADHFINSLADLPGLLARWA
jgi:phosphoserine phosphatase